MIQTKAARIKQLEAEVIGLRDENARLLVANAEARAERIEHYEGWLLEQKLALLELANRVALKEGEARYYGDVDVTSEELRARVKRFAHKATGEQVTWKEVGVVEHAVNTLVYRITQQLPPEVFRS